MPGKNTDGYAHRQGPSSALTRAPPGPSGGGDADEGRSLDVEGYVDMNFNRTSPRFDSDRRHQPDGPPKLGGTSLSGYGWDRLGVAR